MKVAIIDYGIGNVRSIGNALAFLSIESILTRDKNEIINADAVILPGVGAFEHGMNNLKKFDLLDTIYEFVTTGKPFIGICLGMQLLLEQSEEFGVSKGLGLIKGKVIKMPILDNKSKLPHISWNRITEPTEGAWDSTLLGDVKEENNYYFVHSFIAAPEDKSDVLANCMYAGIEFCAAVKHKNIYGFQFHPEKSGSLGLEILKNLKYIV